jgi:hypothetical protein
LRFIGRKHERFIKDTACQSRKHKKNIQLRHKTRHVEPFGSTLEELTQSIEDFKTALTLPVLTLNDIPESSPTLETRKNGQTISHEQLRAQLGLTTAQENTTAALLPRNKKAS